MDVTAIKDFTDDRSRRSKKIPKNRQMTVSDSLGIRWIKEKKVEKTTPDVVAITPTKEEV